MNTDSSIADIVANARADGRSFLLETEGLGVLEKIGFKTPLWRFIPPNQSFSGPLLPGKKAVLKVVSQDLQHKSDSGGVRIVENSIEDLNMAIDGMRSALKSFRISGFLVTEFIEHKPALGHEILIGLRNTRDFGPVVNVGIGGIYAENISRAINKQALSVLVPQVFSDESIADSIEQLVITPLVTGKLRGQKPDIETGVLLSNVKQLLSWAGELIRLGVSEFEINPLVISNSQLIALDVLIKLSPETQEKLTPTRPITKLTRLLKPQRIGIIGVSEKMNPGRIILKNLIRDKFPSENIFVIKPGLSEIDGCRCYPDIASLPQTLDLLVLAISASQVPQAVLQVIEHKKAESLLVIPAGLEEKKGNEGLVQQMIGELHKSRETAWGGPIMNGGNCVGIRSEPGGYDTFFIPEYKLPLSGKAAAPIAIISQSGAFTVARASTNAGLFNPRYLISIGNQTDLTAGDYLEFLKDDSAIEVFAVYVEGFKPGDGLKFLRVASEITASGRSVMLYAAGRTEAGSKAMASHTASIAGNHVVTRELCRLADIILVESSADFDEWLRLFTFLRGKEVGGMRLGAISNAGFDCVAIADNVSEFVLENFSEDTHRKIAQTLTEGRLADILDVHNPLDVSPSATDGIFSAAMEAILNDPCVDTALFANVPITPALDTLPAGEGHRENFPQNPQSVVLRTLALKEKSAKAWVACIDGGPLYDPMVRHLLEGGVPVFRSIDRAVRLFEAYCTERIRLSACKRCRS